MYEEFLNSLLEYCTIPHICFQGQIQGGKASAMPRHPGTHIFKFPCYARVKFLTDFIVMPPPPLYKNPISAPAYFTNRSSPKCFNVFYSIFMSFTSRKNGYSTLFTFSICASCAFTHLKRIFDSVTNVCFNKLI